MTSFVTATLIGVSLGAQYALLALGFTLIFGILGVVNFAHGGFYVLGGYAAYWFVSAAGLPYPLAVVLATLVTGILGYLFELLLIERLVDDHLATLMLTLGLYLMLSTGILITFGPESPLFEFPLNGTLRAGPFYFPIANLVVLAVCLLAILGVYALIFRTDLGRALRALADDRQVAAAQGLRPRLLFPLAFALACGLAGMTGALVTPILSLAPHVGDPVLATSFLIVILGGLGSIGGATVAAFLVGLVEAYSSVYLGGSKGALALFVLVLIILVVRPSGLFGRIAREA
ncbi:High-affinity branched-chain amino acid transport system permease protein LivH [Methylobacterium brachiatum]|uniref:branched-chain amino acid ABC transporter permease n=1 Tax=Methylobacterium sp. E-066 TaxID=2836584 RepID=UPI00138005C6|nr:branched-chain amino acid ABC transporter permease [Methylobacterium sp. E-066]MCJ2144788.1 branched-chain amino acid ABC transporter permease [Methylobacterium sp. E-066]CAA2158554.1 High-affinity branched-chain amino acid transport system permease protein LivH [Methylobacterium brachiatum]